MEDGDGAEGGGGAEGGVEGGVQGGGEGGGGAEGGVEGGVQGGAEGGGEGGAQGGGEGGGGAQVGGEGGAQGGGGAEGDAEGGAEGGGEGGAEGGGGAQGGAVGGGGPQGGGVPQGGGGPHSHFPQAGDWCTCRNCKEMPLDVEKLCCGGGPESCLSRLPDMDLYVLDQPVLRIARWARNDVLALQDGDEPGADLRGFRHAAYRQWVLWHYGRLGQGNRVVVPSCVTFRIRDEFPDPLRQYTGYIPSRL
ncbi:glycine-rich protein DOT1-like isoform X2 [Branchiostoma floridae]|uniref:Glycine-rich protein DOT1-like isoform X2 n=1 Tax=Branchiostoma floridae TaxID=7739 RepID=A0A9J7MUE2_BRAFL|nr:glycine-rich protein DOT1-like isoform X2 [Branchiostoma floridae]